MIRLARRVGGFVLPAWALCLAVAAAPQEGPGASGTPPVATPPPASQRAAAEALTITPGTIALDPRLRSQAVDLTLTARVDPANVGANFAVEVPPELPEGLSITRTLIGTPQPDVSQAGEPTGEVSQQVRLAFDGIPARLDPVSIPLRLRFGQLARTVPMSVSNISALPGTATLAIAVAAEQRWRPGEPIEVVLEAKGAPAPRLSVGAGPFTDAERKNTLRAQFCLAGSPDGACGEEISLAANEQRTAWLEGTANSPEPGSYAGTLRFLASNGLAASTPVTLLVTDRWWRVLGFAALVLGVVLSWVLTVLVPHLRSRDAGLVGFARLGARLSEVEAVAARHNAAAAQAKIGEVREVITQRWLVRNRLLPGWWPGSEPKSNAEELKAHLDAQTRIVAGLEKLAAGLERADTQAKLADLDALAAGTFPPGDLEQQIEAILDPAAPVARTGAFVRRDEPPSLAVLVLRDSMRDVLFWMVSLIVSVALGYVLLIDGDPAFGGWRDVVAALLWGLGLASAGAKLGELTSAQVRTALRPASPAGGK